MLTRKRRRHSHGGARQKCGRKKKESLKHAREAKQKQQWSKAGAKRKTEELEAKLEEMIADITPHRRGRSQSEDLQRLALVFILQYMKQTHCNKTTAIKKAANDLRRGYDGLLTLYNYYVSTGRIFVRGAANRGRGSPKWVNGAAQLGPVHFEFIDKTLHGRAMKLGIPTPLPQLQDILLRDLKLAVQSHVLRYAQMGYSYMKGKPIGAVDLDSPEAIKRLELFLIEISEAKKLEDADEAVLVYNDETYCNTEHARRWGYFKKDSKYGNGLRRGEGKGKRFIILHVNVDPLTVSSTSFICDFCK
jgi:hypothetical protein